jgi:hypothetical protein
MTDYSTYTTDLTIADEQMEVLTLMDRFNTVLWSPNADAGLLSTDDTDVTKSIHPNIANAFNNILTYTSGISNTNTKDEYDDTLVGGTLKRIRGEYSVAIQELVEVLRDRMVDRLRRYNTLHTKYAAFVTANKTRLLKDLVAIAPSVYPNSTQGDITTLQGFTAYSDTFVSTLNGTRNTLAARYSLLRSNLVEPQLSDAIRTFASEYATVPSPRTLQTNLVYTDQDKTDALSLVTVGSVDDLDLVMTTYTSHIDALLLSRTQEAALLAVEHYRDLWVPNQFFMGAVAPSPVSSCGDAQTWETDLTAFRTEPDITTLQCKITTYTGALASFLPQLKDRLHTDLTAWKTLYEKYVAFDAGFSEFYDLEAIPATLRGRNVVDADLAKVSRIGTVWSRGMEEDVNSIRSRYYVATDAVTSMGYLHADLVRFVKSQMDDYIEKYKRNYGDLPDLLKPTDLHDDANLVKVTPAEYVSVSELTTLNTMIDAYIAATPGLREAVRIKGHVIVTQGRIDTFEQTQNNIMTELKLSAVPHTATSILKTLNIDAKRKAVREATTYAAVDTVYMEFVGYFATLATDIMSYFNTIYVENAELEPYFQLNVREIYNTFRVFFVEDAGLVPTNTVALNIDLVQKYVGFIQQIEAAKGEATTEKQGADQYRSDTLSILGSVKSERGIATPYVELTATILALKVDDDIATITTELYVEGMRSLRIAYAGYLDTIRTQMRERATDEIDAFVEAVDATGTIKIFFSTAILEPYNALQKEGTTDRTPIPTATSSPLKQTIDKYVALQAMIVQEKDPKTGVLFTNARKKVYATMNEYLQHIKQARAVAGVDVRLFPDPVFANSQIVRDKATLDKTTSIDVILEKNVDYEAKDAELTKNLGTYALDILENGLLKFYADLEQRGLASYVSDTFKVAKEEGEKHVVNIKAAKLTFVEVLGIVNRYMPIVSSLRLESLRAETVQLLNETEAALKTIAAAEPSFVFSDDIPTLALITRTRTNVLALKQEATIQLVLENYKSLLSSLKTTYFEHVKQTVLGFKTAFDDAKDKQYIQYLRQPVLDAYGVIDANLTTLGAQNVEAATAVGTLFGNAGVLLAEDVSSSKTHRDFDVLQKEVLQLIVDLKSGLGVAATLPDFRPGIADTTVEDKAAVEAILFTQPKGAEELLGYKTTYAKSVANLLYLMQNLALNTLDQFNQKVRDNRALNITYTTPVRLGILGLATDVKTVQTTTHLDTLRDLVRKYSELATQLVSQLPTSQNIDIHRSETLQIISNYVTALESAKPYNIGFTTTIQQANPAADIKSVNDAKTITAITAIRTKYMQFLYEITQKMDDAKAAAKTAMDAKRATIRQRMRDFSTELAKAAVDMGQYPDLQKAKDDMDMNGVLVEADSTGLETLDAIEKQYVAALDVLRYGNTLETRQLRYSKQQVTLLAMNQFSQLMQSHGDARFSEAVQRAALGVTGDLMKLQSPITPLSDLDAMAANYTTLTEQLSLEIQVFQQTGTTEAIQTVRRFRALYEELAPVRDKLPDFLQFDPRMIDRDIATLGRADVGFGEIQNIRIRYKDYIKSLKEAVPSVGTQMKTYKSLKGTIVTLMQNFNQLALDNGHVLEGRLTPSLTARLRAVANDLAYITDTNSTVQELQELRGEYQAAIEELQDVLANVTPSQRSELASSALQSVMDVFNQKYASADRSKVTEEEWNYLRLLFENQQNARIVRNQESALASYNRGIAILSRLPLVEEEVENSEFAQLKFLVNAFLSEFRNRNLARVIPNDRLFLSELKRNSATYLEQYKEPAANQRNYSVLVEQVMIQYRDGLRILRSYPLVVEK